MEWARKIRGLRIDDAATLLGVAHEDLRAYESGEKKPMVGFLRQMSSKYQINFTSLLMPEPLPIENPPTDHRARRGERSLSIDTLVAIEEVAEALESFEDIAEKERLLQGYKSATAQYSAAVSDLQSTRGTTSRDDYERLRLNTEQARLKGGTVSVSARTARVGTRLLILFDQLMAEGAGVSRCRILVDAVHGARIVAV